MIGVTVKRPNAPTPHPANHHEVFAIWTKGIISLAHNLIDCKPAKREANWESVYGIRFNRQAEMITFTKNNGTPLNVVGKRLKSENLFLVVGARDATVMINCVLATMTSPIWDHNSSRVLRMYRLSDANAKTALLLVMPDDYREKVLSI